MKGKVKSETGKRGESKDWRWVHTATPSETNWAAFKISAQCYETSNWAHIAGNSSSVTYKCILHKHCTREIQVRQDKENELHTLYVSGEHGYPDVDAADDSDAGIAYHAEEVTGPFEGKGIGGEFREETINILKQGKGPAAVLTELTEKYQAGSAHANPQELGRLPSLAKITALRVEAMRRSGTEMVSNVDMLAWYDHRAAIDRLIRDQIVLFETGRMAVCVHEQGGVRQAEGGR